MIELFVLIVFAGIVFSALSDYSLGYFIAIASFFILPESARVVFGPIDANFHTLVMFSMILLFSIKKGSSLLLKHGKINKHIIKVITPLVIFCFASFALLLISALISEVPLSYQISRMKSELLSVIFGFIIFFNIKSIKDKNVFFKIFIGAIIFVCVYGILTYITKSNPYAQIFSLTFDGEEYSFALKFMEEVRGFINGRIQSTFRHPLTLGQVMALSLSFFLLIKRKTTFIVSAILVILMLSMVVLSGSRAAILSVIVFVFLGFFHHRKITTKIIYGTITLIFIIAVSISNFPKENNYLTFFKATVFFWDRDLQREANISGSSGELRKKQFEATIEELDNGNWIFGKGKGYRGYLQNHLGKDSELMGFESVVILKLVEEGVFGLFFFLLLGFQLYFAGKKELRISGNYKKLLPGYNAYFLSYLTGIVLTGVRAPSLLLFITFYMVILKTSIIESRSCLDSNC